MKNIAFLSLVSLLSFGGCSSTPTSTGDTSAGGASGTGGNGGTGGSSAGSAGTTAGSSGTAGTSTGGTSAGTAGTGGTSGSGPGRTATTRGLLATSTRSVLLDPFTTSDDSWGHFVGFLLPQHVNQFVQVQPARAFVSLSPGGVAAPVASLPTPSSVHSWGTGVQVIAPFPGGSDTFDARIWVSQGDMSGSPVPFDPATVTIALFPNDLPSMKYPLSKASSPVSYAGREWVALSVPSPVSMPQGGWFSITLEDPQATVQLQAPEVVPTGMASPAPVANAVARSARDSTTLNSYVAVTRRSRKR